MVPSEVNHLSSCNSCPVSVCPTWLLSNVPTGEESVLKYICVQIVSDAASIFPQPDSFDDRTIQELDV